MFSQYPWFSHAGGVFQGQGGEGVLRKEGYRGNLPYKMELVSTSGGTSQAWKHRMNRISLEEACSTTGSGTCNGQPYLGMLSSRACGRSCVGRLKYTSDGDFDECLLFVCRVLWQLLCELVQCKSAPVSSSPAVYHMVQLLGMALLGVNPGYESPTLLPFLLAYARWNVA